MGEGRDGVKYLPLVPVTRAVRRRRKKKKQGSEPGPEPPHWDMFAQSRVSFTHMAQGLSPGTARMRCIFKDIGSSFPNNKKKMK
jgi:hypothetical protein